MTNKKEEDRGLAVLERSPILTGTPAQIQQMQEIMAEVIGPGETVDQSNFKHVTWPGAGAEVWELPDGSGGKTIDCIILKRVPVRAYWIEPFSGEGSPPDCASGDNLKGIPLDDAHARQEGYGGTCVDCPLSDWGTAIGQDGEPRRGQACRQITRLFFLWGEEQMPCAMNVPPTSYKECFNYVLGLGSTSTPYWTVVTSIGLRKTTAKTGEPYSIGTFQVPHFLDSDAIERVVNYRNFWAPTFAAEQMMPTSADLDLGQDDGSMEAASSPIDEHEGD